MPYIISKACTKCGACIVECPTGSIIEGPAHYLIDTDTCADFAACAAVCPANAIAPAPEEFKSGEDDEEIKL
jgi:ferredoxin